MGAVILIVMSCFFINMFHAQQLSTEDQAHRLGDLLEGMVVPGMQWWAHPHPTPTPTPHPYPYPYPYPSPRPFSLWPRAAKKQGRSSSSAV